MKKILILFVASLFAGSIQAQESAERHKLPHQEKRYTIALQPLWWYNNAFRFDFETRIKDTPSWLQISPVVHYFTHIDYGFGYRDYNSIMFSGDEIRFLFGYGVELNYKHFFNKKESLYFAGGCSYVHHNAYYNGSYWNTYVEKGLQYYTDEYGSVHQEINKFGINAYFGYQIPSRRLFLFDMFAGIGYRRSFHDNPAAKLLDEGMLSPGYTGLVIMTGIRIGLKFK